METSVPEYYEVFGDFHGVLMDKQFTKYWEEIETFLARPDDLLIASYPKSGTTWICEIVDMIYKEGDVEKCKEDASFNRIPFLECKSVDLIINGIKQLKEKESPRIVKTHLPPKLLPASFWEKNCKVIYLCRNAKDVVVSYYYFFLIIKSYPNPKSFSEFVEKFMEGQVPYGSWYDHVKSWWEKSKNSRVLFMFYEDMKEDIRREVLKLLKFLEREPSAEIVDKILQHTSFQEMKNNPYTNYTMLPESMIDLKVSPFMRKGIVGDWKNHFPEALRERFEEHYQQQMKDCPVKFRAEL